MKTKSRIFWLRWSGETLYNCILREKNAAGVILEQSQGQGYASLSAVAGRPADNALCGVKSEPSRLLHTEICTVCSYKARQVHGIWDAGRGKKSRKTRYTVLKREC